MKPTLVTTLICGLFLMLTGPVQANGPASETAVIDGHHFVRIGGIWLHEALDEDYLLTPARTSMRGDERWQRWYGNGSETLQRFLRLSPSVIFKFVDGRGKATVFGAFQSRHEMKRALANPPTARTAFVLFETSPEIAPQSRVIAGQSFSLIEDTWVEDELGSDYVVPPENCVLHHSEQWKVWYENGNDTLRQILDLGSNVVFRYRDQRDQLQVFASFASKERIIAATGLNGHQASSTKVDETLLADMKPSTAIIIGASTIAAGYTIVETNRASGSVTPNNPNFP
jgi:hypothetical protein